MTIVTCNGTGIRYTVIIGEKKMKNPLIVAMCIVAAAVLLLLAVFIVIDGIPAASAIASLIDVMQVR